MHTKIFDLGTQSVKIETGLIAKQANASATVNIDGKIEKYNKGQKSKI